MISSIDSCAAASPTSGMEPAPNPSVTLAPSWISFDAFDMASAWASVLATRNSAPCNPAAIMLLTALPPPPPTPITVILGFISVIADLAFIAVFLSEARLPVRDRRHALRIRTTPAESREPDRGLARKRRLCHPSGLNVEVSILEVFLGC